MTGGEDDGGAPRVSIPDGLRETIEEIKKKVAVNNSDEDIYEMLKRCNMDSDEATRVLQYLDSFQLVKSKRKVRVPRVDDYSDEQNVSSDDYNGGRKFNSNLERMPSKSSTSVPRSSKSTDVASSNHKSTAQQTKVNGKVNGNKDDKDVRSRRASSSTSTNPSKKGSHKIYKPKQNNLGSSSSASGAVSNPVVLPSVDNKNSLPVGTIKRETTNDQNVSQALVSGSVDLTSCNTQSQVNGSLKETSEDTCSKNSTSELEVKPKQSVIFPAHFHVPENLISALSFGSFESNNRDSSDSVDHETSPIPQTSSQISGHGDYPDQTSHAPLNLTSSEENILSGADLRYDQSEQDILQSVGRSNDSLLDYGSSLAPPAVQHQGLETQGENTGIIPSSSQPTTCMTPSDPTQPKLGYPQNSVPLSPHMFNYYRPTFSTSYMPPFSPYYPTPLYMPQQNAHPQLSSHNGYPHQSSTSDNYAPPTALSASVPKIPPYKSAGGIPHFGNPSPYGFGAFLDDMSRSEPKEKNMHSNLPPQGQASPNPFSGTYHPSQSIQTPSLHQSQPPPLPSLSSYPHPQLLSLSQQQFGQHMGWNKKFQN